ncbi:MAG: type II secretion system F family protein [Candidatus Aenigmarchaeota archaeon]|nr:type II secretion system F family protein [Candidatus Aenigmarchaeota archaeon]
MKMNKQKYMLIASVVVGIIMFIVNQITFKNELIMILSILVTVAMPIILEYNKFRVNKEIEERFPDFLRDISENIRAGMTLPQAVLATKKTDYGLLDPYLDKMAVQIDWGIPFDKILNSFAKDKSDVIKRTVSVIDEAIKGGGNIAKVLDTIGRSVAEINKLRKERMSSTYSQMLTGYVIFFVFLGVLVALQTFLIPGMNLTGSGFTGTMISYGILFKQMILIQGFFSGLVIGKMSEGRTIAGLKHSLILMIVGYVVLSMFV